MRARGFTLVELVTVLVIVGALAVTAVARFNPGTFEARAAADELVAALRYAQEKSMTNTGAPPFQIQVTGSGYSVTQNGVAIPHPVTGAAGYTSSWSNVSVSPTATISFDGYGEPTLLAGAWSGNQLSFTVTVGSESSGVTLERVTGFAR